ncbi:MAG: RNA polymerase sigma factor [Terracidiphilus sp.]|jgi:RNA polymerase sigma-70 factor (ECF subfamily)
MADTFPISLLESTCPPKLGPAHLATPAKSDVENVLTRAQAGDHDAFSELYLEHRTRVFSNCLRMVHDFSLAEDLTQDVFLQLHRRLITFRGDSAFTTWLHRLTVNIVLMHLRKRAPLAVSLDNLMTDNLEERVGRDFGTPDLAQAGTVDRLDIHRALATLAPGYRNTFVMHDVHGFEHHEIASMNSHSIGNSKSQLHKARRALRDALSAQRVQRTVKLEASQRSSSN